MTDDLARDLIAELRAARSAVDRLAGLLAAQPPQPPPEDATGHSTSQERPLREYPWYRYASFLLRHLIVEQGFGPQLIAHMVSGSAVWQTEFTAPVTASGIQQCANGEIRYQAKRGKSYPVLRETKARAIAQFLAPLVDDTLALPPDLAELHPTIKELHA